MSVPANPKIYHIVHVDRLPSIVADEALWCDLEVVRRAPSGTTIGMGKIKERRLRKTLESYPNLHVGDCVPFYFCSRSVMLFMFHRNNHPEIDYHGGQQPIVHLVADLRNAVQWATENERRWVFTDSNAGSLYFNDYADLNQLDEIDWKAVNATSWAECREQKQAEFLMEYNFPWHLIERIGVYSKSIYQRVAHALPTAGHRPLVEIRQEWYY